LDSRRSIRLNPEERDNSPPLKGIFWVIERFNDELAWLCGVKTVFLTGHVPLQRQLGVERCGECPICELLVFVRIAGHRCKRTVGTREANAIPQSQVGGIDLR
jgi:hypothetical protein